MVKFFYHSHSSNPQCDDTHRIGFNLSSQLRVIQSECERHCSIQCVANREVTVGWEVEELESDIGSELKAGQNITDYAAHASVCRGMRDITKDWNSSEKRLAQMRSVEANRAGYNWQ